MIPTPQFSKNVLHHSQSESTSAEQGAPALSCLPTLHSTYMYIDSLLFYSHMQKKNAKFFIHKDSDANEVYGPGKKH
jgi:hypothetical protein